jgi:hypothetical protein
MNILFSGMFPLYGLHFITELDHMEKHLGQGDEVYLLSCSADLNTCEPNRSHELANCARCIGFRQSWVDMLSRKPHLLPLLIHEKVPKLIPEKLETIDKLKQLSCDGFDYGEAVYSSLVDRCMSTEPDLRKERKIIQKMAEDSWRIWLNALRVIEKYKIDQVYIFNGRFNTTRALVRACQKKGITFFTHERSMKSDRVFLIKNALPHDPTHHLSRIQKFLNDQWGKKEVLEEAVDFFEERPKGKRCGLKSFVVDQKVDCMPDSWDSSRRNLAIFASTEREFVGVKQFTPKGLYDSQIEAYLDLAKKTQKMDPTIFFYLRIHPNSKAEKIRWWEGQEFNRLNNVEIIPPESDISSYSLLHAVEKTLCFRSSMGMEATYWGKPSIVLTWAFYSGLDAVYEPQTREEALDLTLAILQAKPRANILKYGAFLRCGGEPFKHSWLIDNEITFKGQKPMINSEIQKWHGHTYMRPSVSGFWLSVRKIADSLKWRWLNFSYNGIFSEK